MYPALLPLMRTPRKPVFDWTDAPADLNGLVRFAERRNLVSARVPSHFNWPLQISGSRSPEWPNFVSWHLISVGTRCRTCFMSHWPARGPTQPLVKWVPCFLPGAEVIGAWRWLPTLSSVVVEERAQMYLYSHSCDFKACSRVDFYLFSC